MNKTETDSYTQKTDCQLLEGREVEGVGKKGEGIKQKNPKTKTKHNS